MEKIRINGNDCVIEIKDKRIDFEYDCISHYTSISALKQIIANEEFRASRVDGYRSQYSMISERDIRTIYSVSFTYTEKQKNEDRMWRKYGDNGRGGTIRFLF